MSDPFWLQSESRRLEFKEAWPGGDKIARTVVAFANCAGGRIVFGVRDETHEIVGIPDDQLFPLEERIANHVFDQCVPAIVPEIYIQNVEGMSLLVVEVYPGSQKPYHLKKPGKAEGTYIRVGSVNRKASEDSIAALERARRKTSYDELPAYDVPGLILTWPPSPGSMPRPREGNWTTPDTANSGFSSSNETKPIRPTPQFCCPIPASGAVSFPTPR